MSKMLRFRDTAFLEVPISEVKLAPLADAHFTSVAISHVSNVRLLHAAYRRSGQL